VPRPAGGFADLRVLHGRRRLQGFTTHLMDPHRETAYFLAWSPDSRLAFGYVWRRADFPWLGIWEENHSRTSPPWNGRTLTRGMEFRRFPHPETRRQMIARGSLFSMPRFPLGPARTRVETHYRGCGRPCRGDPRGSGMDVRRRGPV